MGYNGIGTPTFLLGPDVGGGAYSLNGTATLVGGQTSTAVTLPTGATDFGTDLGQSPGSPITIDAEVTLANSQSYTQVLNLTAGSPLFIGFATHSPIATILFLNPNVPTGTFPAYTIYDNFSFGASAPVPEASTTVSLSLLALGLGGLVVAAKRRKSSAP